MDFFRKAADAVGGLILDSDSDSESERGGAAAGRAGRRTAAEKNDKTPMADHWTDGGMDPGADARGASGSDDGAPPEGADGSFETSDDEGDEKLIPDAVWGALAAARGKISEVASTVRADVASITAKSDDGTTSGDTTPAASYRGDSSGDSKSLFAAGFFVAALRAPAVEVPTKARDSDTPS